jgi:hypothetical protein
MGKPSGDEDSSEWYSPNGGTGREGEKKWRNLTLPPVYKTVCRNVKEDHTFNIIFYICFYRFLFSYDKYSK